MRKWFEQIKLFMRRVITSPVGELTRAQRIMRYWLDLIWHCARALRHDRAGEMAAALTYRTIFSLIPLLVMLLLVFQAFRGLDEVRKDMQPLVYKFMRIDALQTPVPTETEAVPDEPKVKPPPTTEAAPAIPPEIKAKNDALSNPEKEAVNEQVMLRVDVFLSDLIAQVSGLDFKSIGVVGFILFIWAAIDLVVTLEMGFNRVFNSPNGRPWHHRIPIYWAVITLGPVLVWLSLSVAGRLVGAAEQIPVLGVMIQWASSLFALAASWLLLFLLYKLMPNTNVQAHAALIGSFVAATLWELGKFGIGLYVSKALPYAKIYGALGLIPLFLFWVYLTWLVVLFGLELTYTLQAMKGKRFKYELPSQTRKEMPGDPQWIIPIITQIAQSFTKGHGIDVHTLADRLALPEPAITHLSTKLAEAGLIHRIEQSEDAIAQFTLSMPPDQIRIQTLLELADTLRHTADPSRQQAGWNLLRDLSKVQQTAAAQTTLDSLLKIPLDTAATTID